MPEAHAFWHMRQWSSGGRRVAHADRVARVFAISVREVVHEKTWTASHRPAVERSGAVSCSSRIQVIFYSSMPHDCIIIIQYLRYLDQSSQRKSLEVSLGVGARAWSTTLPS